MTKMYLVFTNSNSRTDWLNEEPRRVQAGLQATLMVSYHRSRSLDEYVTSTVDAILIEILNGEPVVDPDEVRQLAPNTPLITVEGQPRWAEIEQEVQRQTS